MLYSKKQNGVMKVKRKEIIEQLRQNMPDFQGNDEEVEIKVALYIYVELGKMKSFDEKYYFGNSGTQRKIYDLAERSKRNIEEIVGKRKLICVSLTHLYCDLLKEFGIYAVASEPEEGGHIHPIVVTKNKRTFIADLQLDLENIQTKSRLEHFEYTEDSTRNIQAECNQKAVTEMLIEMGYIQNEKDYKNEEIEKLKEETKNKNPHEALRIIMEDKALYQGNEEMDIVEVNKFFKGTLKKVIPHFLRKRIFAFNCYREREEKERDYTLCVFSEEDTIVPYIYSKKDRQFFKVGIQKMQQLEEEGLNFGAKQKEDGSKKLKKYIHRQMEAREIKGKA
jgi:hypothetical protein